MGVFSSFRSLAQSLGLLRCDDAHQEKPKPHRQRKFEVVEPRVMLTGTSWWNCPPSYTLPPKPQPDCDPWWDRANDCRTDSCDTCATCEETITIDFDKDARGNPLAAGTIIDDEYKALGVSITTSDPTRHPAMIFDSAHPTGGDWDLGTRNESFGGPGKGSGGRRGQAGENRIDRGNVLIISEDGDQSDPDDNAYGGTVSFKFDQPVKIQQIGLLDIDNGESGWIKTYDANGRKTGYYQINGRGDNSFQTIKINESNVSRMDVYICGSGAITELTFCGTRPTPVPPPPPPPPTYHPGVHIEKATNGVDADTGAGPKIAVGNTATFSYVVTNTGDVALANVKVIDDNGTPGNTGDDFAPRYVGGDANGNGKLDLRETWTYQASRVVTPGQYGNEATVTANDPNNTRVVDKDRSHHFGVDAGIHIEKATNGVDADRPDQGPRLGVGTTATFTYVVTNTGNVALKNVTVVDDNGTPSDTSDDFQPTEVLGAHGGYNVGDLDCDRQLDVGETWRYQATRIVTAGLYGNVAKVTASDSTGTVTRRVMDDDPSHHYGVVAGIHLEKATNGQDADTGTGPLIRVGDTATFTYVVTNTGDVALKNVTVIDDNGTPRDTSDDFRPMEVLGPHGGFNIGDLDCDRQLDVGETWQYKATRVVTAGQYGNEATVTGDASGGGRVTDKDKSHHFGVVTGIHLEKATNGVDADRPAQGPNLSVGETATFTYVVTNAGNVALKNVTVTDDQGVVVSFVGGDSNQNNLLDVNETWTYSGSKVVTAGQYTNVGSVAAIDSTGTNPNRVRDTDPSNHFGVVTGIHIEKATNGVDADRPVQGPNLLVGDTATFTYVVTNTGNVALKNVTVTDDNGTPGDTSDDFRPTEVLGPHGGFNIGDLDCDRQLDVGEMWQYTASRTVTAGQYTNVGRVAALDSTGTSPNRVSDTDPSNHFGVQTGIHIEKATNGEDADTGTGPSILVGDTATFTYVVNNTGNVALKNVTVIDDNGTPQDTSDDWRPMADVDAGGFNVGDTDHDHQLDVGEQWLYTASRTVTAGQYRNVGRVVALDSTGTSPNRVRDDDPSNHYGVETGIHIEKATNGEDADMGTGPNILVGDTATFTYVVTNTGNVALSNVVVTDDQGVVVTYVSGDANDNSLLDVDETWTYTGNALVTAGQYTNIGRAVALDSTGTNPNRVRDDDPSNHFGVLTGIHIEKATNGEDADTGTGPNILIGETATFTYVVTNTGNVALANVVVTDDQGVVVTFVDGDTNDNDLLDVDEIWTYTGSAVVTAGQYTNLGTVTAADMTGTNTSPVTDDDPSHHFGVAPPLPAPATISGFVFQDGADIETPDGAPPANLGDLRDGRFTSDDTPIAGVTLELRHSLSGAPVLGQEALPGYYGDGPIRVTTNAQGYYEFNGLRAGNYTVVEVHPADYVDHIETAGTRGGVPTGVAINRVSDISPAIFSSWETAPPLDTIALIGLPAGSSSIGNNFSEVRIVSAPTDPPDPPNPPPTVPPVSPPPSAPPSFPPRTPPISGPPSRLPSPMGAPIFVVLPASAPGSAAGGVLFAAPTVAAPSTFTWHLSVIDAGQPRSVNDSGSTASLRTAPLLVTAFGRRELNEGAWVLGGDREGSLGMPGGIPLTGDFDGDGYDEIAIFHGGQWFIDLNGNGVWDADDLWAELGAAGDRPVVGDWDGDGKDDIGIFGPAWTGDAVAIAHDPGLPDPHNHQAGKPKNVPPIIEEATDGLRTLQRSDHGAPRQDLIDHVFQYGEAGDVPVAGDFNGDGITSIGVYRAGVWQLDTDGDGRLTAADGQFRFGRPGDRPAVGDFDGNGVDDLGVYRDGVWILDTNGNREIDAQDKVFELGGAEDRPVVGDWNGDGIDEPGLYRDGAQERVASGVR